MLPRASTEGERGSKGVACWKESWSKTRLQAAFRTNPSDPSEFRRRHGPRLFETAMLGVPQREGRGRRYTYGPQIIMAYLVMAHIVMAALGVLQREGRRRRSRQGR